MYFKQVKWSGAYQEGAGLTLGEEVEQCLEDWVSDVKEWAEGEEIIIVVLSAQSFWSHD